MRAAFAFLTGGLTLAAASPALAASVGATGGFGAGLLHPILGFDHFLAMLAVGLLSVQIGGRAIWTAPGAFLIALAVGGGLGLLAIPLPEVEGAIALSVLALGLAIALRARLPVAAAMLFVAFFGVFHGHAHGEEIPRLADPAAYVAGFVLASALLHLAGVALGLLQRQGQARALVGAGIAGIGGHILLLTYGIV